MKYAQGTVPGEFIVRGSYGNIIVNTDTGVVLRINDANGQTDYNDITRFDPGTLVPCHTSDGEFHNECDITDTRYYWKRFDGDEGVEEPNEG